MTENIKLYQAAENEIEEITKLYEQAKGSEYCTWDEHYPNIEITRQDLKRNDLFCMKTETGEIVGAISIDDDKEVEGLSCWSLYFRVTDEQTFIVLLAAFAAHRDGRQYFHALFFIVHAPLHGDFLCTVP